MKYMKLKCESKFFSKSGFRGDFFGGLTAGVVALPLALAFGVSSGLGPSAGLYGAIFLSFFAAILGGTCTQISGPTAPMTALSMTIIASIMASNEGNVEIALPLILTVFLLSGLFQILFGVIGLGSYIKYIPSSVVSGFMTAIGVMIILTQLLPAIGYYPDEDKKYIEQFKAQAEENILENILIEEVGEGILVLEHFDETIKRAKSIEDSTIMIKAKLLANHNSNGVIGTLRVLPNSMYNINYLELFLTIGTIFLVFLFRRINKAIPSALASLIVVSVIAYFLKTSYNVNYEEIEKIPHGLPIFHKTIFSSFSLSSLFPYIISALSLALLGTIDSLLTSVVADNMTKSKHQSNQELIGQGIGNSMSAFFGGLPGAGATIRTVVNIKAGGRTKISGVISSLVLLFILLGASSTASQIPAAVLAGILITVGIDVIDFKGLKRIPKMPIPESAILIIVLVLSVFWNLVFAVGIGLVLASLVFMKKMGDVGKISTKIQRFTSFKKPKDWTDEDELSENVDKQVYIKHLYGPLFFGFTSRFTELINRLPDVKAFVIRFERVPYIDQSGLLALEDAIIELQSSNCEVIFSGLAQQPKDMILNSNIIPDLIKEDKSFDDFATCVKYLKRTLTDSSGEIT